MITIKRYKQAVAILLMALYAFVSTPVQLWHHHNYAAEASCPAGEKDSLSFSSCSGKNADTNCQVCTHQYSAYNDGATIRFAAPLFVGSAIQGFYYNSIPAAPLFNFANKGPPAQA